LRHAVRGEELKGKGKKGERKGWEKGRIGRGKKG